MKIDDEGQILGPRDQDSYQDFDYYTIQAMRSVAPYRDVNEMILNAALGLAGEAGEIVETIKKIRHHGHPFTEGVRKNLLKEVGDILWYCAEMSKALEVPLSGIARDNVVKLMERYPEGFSTDRSLNRPEHYEGRDYAWRNEESTESSPDKSSSSNEETGSISPANNSNITFES